MHKYSELPYSIDVVSFLFNQIWTKPEHTSLAPNLNRTHQGPSIVHDDLYELYVSKYTSLRKSGFWLQSLRDQDAET